MPGSDKQSGVRDVQRERHQRQPAALQGRRQPQEHGTVSSIPQILTPKNFVSMHICIY